MLAAGPVWTAASHHGGTVNCRAWLTGERDVPQRPARSDDHGQPQVGWAVIVGRLTLVGIVASAHWGVDVTTL